MSESEARMKIKAAAYLVASILGWRMAIRLLNEIANEIEAEQWK